MRDHYERRPTAPPDKTKPRYVYFAHDGHPQQRVKIGLSRTIDTRLRLLHCQLLFAVPCEYQFARTLEQELHKQFANLRLPDIGGEGGSEWFRVDHQLSRLIQFVRRTGYWPWDYSKVVI